MKMPKLTKAIELMYARYGQLEHRKCKECSHLILHFSPAGKKFFKCDLTKMTRGKATDWRANWIACGRFFMVR